MKKKIMLIMTTVTAMLSMTGCSSAFGEKMAKAGMNTLMGMGTVFCVLIFIAFLISRFKYIAKFEAWIKNRKEDKKVSAVTPAKSPVPAAPVQEVEEAEDETDDLELVAVITAALAASLNTSTDKLIVRSIRRKNTNRW